MLNQVGGDRQILAKQLGISPHQLSYVTHSNAGDAEFMFSRKQYATITRRDQGKRDVIGYHLRISFKPGETDAATANRIGYELAMKLTHRNHAFVCCTHTDRAHIHTHGYLIRPRLTRQKSSEILKAHHSPFAELPTISA